MLARIFMVLALLTGAKEAYACAYEAATMDVAVKAADKAFVGSVRTVENGLAIFNVEKGIKNIKDGETFEVEMQGRAKGSCNIDFQPGQRWLYLGPTHPAGTLLLQDEHGRAMTESVALVKQKFDIKDEGGDVLGGTIKRSCAPWDGAAFTIQLDNNISASVYVSPGELDKKDKNSIVSYQANGKSERGSGAIVQCPKPKEGSTENLPCRSLQGTVSIGFVTADDVTGNINVTEGEHHSLYVFRVKRVEEQVFCG